MYRNKCFVLCILSMIVASILAPSAAQAQRAQRAGRPYPKAPDQSHGMAAENLLAQIWSAQPGAAKFAAMDAVVKAYKESDAQTRSAIDWLTLYYMRDKNRAIIDRWPCEYVLQRVDCKLAIPWVIDELLLDRITIMRSVAAEALGLWYKSSGDKTILDAMRQAASSDPSQEVRDTLDKYLSSAAIISGPGAPDEGHRKAADAILKQIWDAEPQGPKFVAINAVVAKYKSSDIKTQQAITWLCLAYTKDKTRSIIDRWPCEYVLQRVGYEPAIPDLIDELLNDKVEAMRAVAAEALGTWWKSSANPTILDALNQSARTETSKWVRDTLVKYLGSNMPAPGS